MERKPKNFQGKYFQNFGKLTKNLSPIHFQRNLILIFRKCTFQYYKQFVGCRFLKKAIKMLMITKKLFTF